ncbi:hypothetical protein FGO68_gene4513 [Halteria grandinella]|uniref:TLDc domain-containing protein n=1 Tax=Halteria grandinella TaxID=5974 RepID=A0A8J8NYM0_HALGN|nr:hypothetical protein FGO68_gene4513 [Halteria grandinella]
MDSKDNQSAGEENKEESGALGKTAKCVLYGLGSAAVAAGGAALMLGTGGTLAVAAGGILFSGGLSAEVNTLAQTIKNEKFNDAELLTSAGIGMAGGIIAAPFAIGGGMVAGGVTNAGVKFVTQVTGTALGGSVSGAGTQVIQNYTLTNNKWNEGVGKAAGMGFIAGAVGGGLGQACGSAGKEIAQKIPIPASEKAQMAIKAALSAASGAIGGGVTAGLVKAVDNYIQNGRIDEGDLTFIKSPQLKHQMWQWLVINGYIADNQITGKCDTLKDAFLEKIDQELVAFQKQCIVMLKTARSLWKGVGSAATSGAILAAVQAGMSSIAMQKQEQRLQNELKNNQDPSKPNDQSNHQTNSYYEQREGEPGGQYKIEKLPLPPNENHNFQVNSLSDQRVQDLSLRPLGDGTWIDKFDRVYNIKQAPGKLIDFTATHIQKETYIPNEIKNPIVKNDTQNTSAAIQAALKEKLMQEQTDDADEDKEKPTRKMLEDLEEQLKDYIRFAEEKYISQVRAQDIDFLAIERQNYMKNITKYDSKYFLLRHALFSLNQLPDGAYHVTHSIHHKIGIKIGKSWHMFDYAGQQQAFIKEFANNFKSQSKKVGCKVGASKNYEYNAKIIQKIEEEAIYLGPIQKSIEEITHFALNISGFQNSLYDKFRNNCRTFVHALAKWLGLEAQYASLVKKFSYNCPFQGKQEKNMYLSHSVMTQPQNQRSLLVGKAIVNKKVTAFSMKDSLFGKSSILQGEDEHFSVTGAILGCYDFKSSVFEYSLGGMQRFGSCLSDKAGSLIFVQTAKGTKFLAFFKAKIPFSNGVVESHLDNCAFLMNISSEKVFPLKTKDKRCVHTHTQALGLNAAIFFGQEGKDYSNEEERQCDLRISRQTVVTGPYLSSKTGLPTFGITVGPNGTNDLTGETEERIQIKDMEIWSLQ